ncbi:DUF488 domain-containing protein [Methylocaldum szegediense]|jgi:uncharacterized protein YeaO (DUF488 family)|uniref:DUF488 domain-containing protein YeaO n=1 Tax=Methylocaldum szegediense TaxID=73780 RepID=A0ABM9I191_9GAMM|nr:DUF488 family protein [Methylocaldum szegediense]CAI8824299.1 putative DUF488 domain-containing protein YeaO [Methylocaldum szegediense]
MVFVKRVYEPLASGDGERYLVERLWPRGITKEALMITAWIKEAAPSTELRRWFGHEPSKWNEFRQRYFSELDRKPEVIRPLLEAATRGNITLLYSARDTEHNSAIALAEYLSKRLAQRSD